MKIFENTDIKGFEKVIFFSNEYPPVEGIIAIHSTLHGPALGGCRIYNYPNIAAGVNDVLLLAEAMTYKNTIVDLPFGGGKTIIYKNSKVSKDASLKVFAEVLNYLDGRYFTTDDVGTSIADMDYLRLFSPYVRGILCDGKQINATSYGVYQAIKATIYHKERKEDLQGLKVIIQGLGKVGYPLCRYLFQAGCELYVYDPIKKLVDRAVEEFSAIPIVINSKTRIYADVFCPCALGGVINHKNKNSFDVKYIIGGANNQLSDLSIADYLHNKGITYIPDYLCNSGGVIDIHSENDYSEKNVLEKVSIIYKKTIEILRRAELCSQNPLETANQYVHTKLKK